MKLMDKDLYTKYQDYIYLDYEELNNLNLNIVFNDNVLIIEDEYNLYCYYNIKGFTPFKYRLYQKLYLCEESYNKINLSKFMRYKYNVLEVIKNNKKFYILNHQPISYVHSQLDLEQLMEEMKFYKQKKKLLLHSCCGPCSSYTLEYLHEFFDITIFYNNSNIDTLEEFNKRVETQKQIIEDLGYDIKLVVCEYKPNEYYNSVKGYEALGEFSYRCYKCYEFRLINACCYAKKNNFDYFTTTLSISPYKNSEWINKIGLELENKYQMKYLYSNFKLHDGYKKSIELSKKYHLYRQDYCGCIYSKKEMEQHERTKD